MPYAPMSDDRASFIKSPALGTQTELDALAANVKGDRTVTPSYDDKDHLRFNTTDSSSTIDHYNRKTEMTHSNSGAPLLPVNGYAPQKNEDMWKRGIGYE